MQSSRVRTRPGRENDRVIGHATGQMLSLGADGEVLGPPELRARVRNTPRAVAARYRPRAAPVRRSPRPRKLA